MPKPDDCSLTIEQFKAVERRAHSILDRTDGWGRFPTPIDDILAAAELKISANSIFDPNAIMAYVLNKAKGTASLIKSALSKILGIYDAGACLIHVDHTVNKPKQTFLKLHEIGHHEIPTHRKVYRLFQDCEKTLSPDVADLFDREANNFARIVLFQGDTYARMATDYNIGVKAPLKLSRKFGASVYASFREYARTRPYPCLVYVLNPIEYKTKCGPYTEVRRIEYSKSFEGEFPVPTDVVVTIEHHLWRVLPLGRKMTSPTPIVLADRNYEAHEFLAEAFDSTFNIFILLYPARLCCV